MSMQRHDVEGHCIPYHANLTYLRVKNFQLQRLAEWIYARLRYKTLTTAYKDGRPDLMPNSCSINATGFGHDLLSM